MKVYVKPEMECVDFVTENVNYNTDINPYGDVVGGVD